MPGPLDITFTAVLGQARAGNTGTCVELPGSAEVFGPRGLVEVPLHRLPQAAP
jgi:hypothetical protein